MGFTGVIEREERLASATWPDLGVECEDLAGDRADVGVEFEDLGGDEIDGVD